MSCNYCETAYAVGASESCPCEDEPRSCEECGGALGFLGILGRRVHLQCRDCGASYSLRRPDEPIETVEGEA